MNSQLEWKKKDKPQLIKDREIIIATWDKKSKAYRYAVVFYYEPMGLWYGGAGVKVRPQDVEYRADIPPPTSR